MIEAKGKCYEQAAKLLLDGLYDDLILCHGYLKYPGKGEHYGKKCGHAWCELNEFVFEFKPNGEEVLIPKQDYYELGQIRPADVKRYTAEEAMANIVSTGHWGEWP